MSSTPSILFAAFESAAVVFILLGLALLRRKLARNDIYARWSSPSMLREASVWRAINAATGRDFIAIGATLSALAVGLWIMSSRPEVFALACAGWARHPGGQSCLFRLLGPPELRLDGRETDCAR